MATKHPTFTENRRTHVFISPTFNATVPIVANDLEGAITHAVKVDRKITASHLIEVREGPSQPYRYISEKSPRIVPQRDGRANDWEDE